MKDLLDKWTERMTGGGREFYNDLGLCVANLKSYIAACAVRDAPVSVEEFRRHETKHGPWLRVRKISLQQNREVWHQARCAVVDAIGGSYVVAHWGRSAAECESMDRGRVEWQWSDADGNAMPGPDWTVL